MSIIRERANSAVGDSDKIALATHHIDTPNVHMTGQSIDRIYKNGVLVKEIVDHNLVVNTFMNLITCLLKGQSGYAGIQYWAIGQGSASWDSQDEPPTPSLTDTRLASEIGRVAISAGDISFLNSSYEVVSSPTNILQIEHTFGEGDCNGKWREFGIFGGNATETLNSGLMINRRTHGVITKTSDMTVKRTMRFTLNLV